MAIIDAVIRLVPGVLGDAESSGNDLFRAGAAPGVRPVYAPRVYRGLEVPPAC